MPWITRIRKRSISRRRRLAGTLRAEKAGDLVGQASPPVDGGRRFAGRPGLARHRPDAGPAQGRAAVRADRRPRRRPGQGTGAPGCRGQLHTPAEWPGRPAAVLVFLAPDCPISRDYADELASLAGEFGPRGIVFFGIDPTPGPRRTRRRGVGRAGTFPSPSSPTQPGGSCAGGRGGHPEAVVVLPDGQVIYRGRIDDQYAADGRKRPRPDRSDLKAALDAILADEMPAAQRRGGPRHPAGPDRDVGRRSGRGDHVQQARRADPLE